MVGRISWIATAYLLLARGVSAVTWQVVDILTASRSSSSAWSASGWGLICVTDLLWRLILGRFITGIGGRRIDLRCDNHHERLLCLFGCADCTRGWPMCFSDWVPLRAALLGGGGDVSGGCHVLSACPGSVSGVGVAFLNLPAGLLTPIPTAAICGPSCNASIFWGSCRWCQR